ncbi:MBL fold metallo-hydrolase [Photobacterium sp. MCCC 1A19761]|uniref:MBL fold metallo-hydrolase n=1 Tax=Photobacterium sp. MCCC 1A19761 TaxID=3115000 RepID=UPI00307CCF39
MMKSIEILSGLAPKAPAAIILNTPHQRFLLDAGACIGTADVPWSCPADIDAVFISHDHVDHIGGIGQIPQHIPVYCSAFVASQLPDRENIHVLPVQGCTDIMGVTVRTGSAGHALGGIWFHFDIDGGVFYSGDFCFESELFRFDLPPPAKVALLDMSYGNYDSPMNHQKVLFEEALTQHNKSGAVLLPVPASGRGIEMAMWLATRYPAQVCIDRNGFRHINQAMAQHDIGLQPEQQAQLKALSESIRVIEHPSDIRSSDIILAGSADLDCGLAKTLLDQKHDALQKIIFTGYMGPLVKAIYQQRPSRFIRWNVHPTFSDNARLIRHLGCETVIPLFHPDLSSLQTQLGDSKIHNHSYWSPFNATYA